MSFRDNTKKSSAFHCYIIVVQSRRHGVGTSSRRRLVDYSLHPVNESWSVDYSLHPVVE